MDSGPARGEGGVEVEIPLAPWGSGGGQRVAGRGLRVTSQGEGRACLPHGAHGAPDTQSSAELEELLAKTWEKQAEDQLARPSSAVAHRGRQRV